MPCSAAGFQVCKLSGCGAGGDCPVALAIGVDPAYIVASAPACTVITSCRLIRAIWQRFSLTVRHHPHRSLRHQPQLYSAGVIGVSVSCVFGWIFAAMYGFFKCTLRAARDYAARHFRITNKSYRLEAMSNKPFIYQAPFPWGKTIPNTIYSLPITLALPTRRRNNPESGTRSPDSAGAATFHDASFMLRPAHQKQVAAIFTIQKPAKTTSTWRCNS